MTNDRHSQHETKSSNIALAQNQRLTNDSKFHSIESVEPIGIRIPIFRLGTFFLTLILLSVIWNLFLTPNSYGKPLATALHAMDKMGRTAGSSPQYVKIKIDPIRNTTGSVWSSNLASMMQTGDKKSQSMGGMLANFYSPAIVMAMQDGQDGLSAQKNDCTVRVSAQAFDFPGTPYASILSRVGSREDSFVLMLAHEMAHCYWNPGPLYERRLNKIEKDPEVLKKMLSLMPLVRNIAESYADSYALIFSARMDSGLYARGYQGLYAFRSEKNGQSNIYDTLSALQTAAEMVPTLPGKSDPLSVRWDVTNRFAMSAAFTGSLKWLMDKGVKHDEAIESIKFVLKGQDIEFSPHIIGSKEYLIVSRTPEDAPFSQPSDSSALSLSLPISTDQGRLENKSKNISP